MVTSDKINEVIQKRILKNYKIEVIQQEETRPNHFDGRRTDANKDFVKFEELERTLLAFLFLPLHSRNFS